MRVCAMTYRLQGPLTTEAEPFRIQRMQRIEHDLAMTLLEHRVRDYGTSVA